MKSTSTFSSTRHAALRGRPPSSSHRRLARRRSCRRRCCRRSRSSTRRTWIAARMRAATSSCSPMAAWLAKRHDSSGVFVVRRRAGHGRPQRARGALGARRCHEAAGDASRANSTNRKLGTFYATCMDSAVPRRPVSPRSAHRCRRSTRSRRKRGLLTRIAELQKTGANVAFRFGPDVDAHDATHYIAGIDRADSGCPIATTT